MQEPLRFFEWQRAQEKIVDKTEDRSVQADPERESHDSNDSESGRFAELSQSETEFVHDRSQLESFSIILFAERRSDRHAWRGELARSRRSARRAPAKIRLMITAPASIAPTL